MSYRDFRVWRHWHVDFAHNFFTIKWSVLNRKPLYTVGTIIPIIPLALFVSGSRYFFLPVFCFHPTIKGERCCNRPSYLSVCLWSERNQLILPLIPLSARWMITHALSLHQKKRGRWWCFNDTTRYLIFGQLTWNLIGYTCILC